MSKLFLSRLKELQGSNSVSAFARYLEMPQKTVDTYIKDQRKPSVEFVVRVCSKCGVSADWLLGLSEDRGGSQSAAPMTLVTKKRQTLLEPHDEILIKFAALEKRVEELESSAIRYLNQPTAACCG